MQKSPREPLLSVTLYIVFFSYIWFKYDILQLHSCNLCGVVVNAVVFQPGC